MFGCQSSGVDVDGVRFGQVEWTFMWKELTGPPRVTSKGLELNVPAAKRGFSLFGGTDGVKMVPITDGASAQVSGRHAARWQVGSWHSDPL